MSLTYGFKSALDLYEKLERDAERIRSEVSSDRFFNFVVTGYSLIDWVTRDPSIPEPAKADDEIDWLRKDPWIKICGDLAIASKHFMLTERKPIIAGTKSGQGFGVGRYGKGSYGVGEERILIELSDGRKYTALELADGVTASWQRYFRAHALLR